MEDTRFTVTLTQKDGFEFAADFGIDGVPELRLDEPWPLSHGRGPNAARVLGAAVAHCLSASLLFCLTKARIPVKQMRTTVDGTIARGARGRLRIRGIRVRLEPEVAPEDRERMSRCLGIFEDFCIVTQGVRHGISVDVAVRPPQTDLVLVEPTTGGE